MQFPCGRRRVPIEDGMLETSDKGGRCDRRVGVLMAVRKAGGDHSSMEGSMLIVAFPCCSLVTSAGIGDDGRRDSKCWCLWFLQLTK